MLAAQTRIQLDHGEVSSLQYHTCWKELFLLLQFLFLLAPLWGGMRVTPMYTITTKDLHSGVSLWFVSSP